MKRAPIFWRNVTSTQVIGRAPETQQLCPPSVMGQRGSCARGAWPVTDTDTAHVSPQVRRTTNNREKKGKSLCLSKVQFPELQNGKKMYLSHSSMEKVQLQN